MSNVPNLPNANETKEKYEASKKVPEVPRKEIKSTIMAKKIERKSATEPPKLTETSKPQDPTDAAVETPCIITIEVEAETSGSGSTKVHPSSILPFSSSILHRPSSRKTRHLRSPRGLTPSQSCPPTSHCLPWQATTSPSSISSWGPANGRRPFQNHPNRSHLGTTICFHRPI